MTGEAAKLLVGVGASAGGLTALKSFLGAFPQNTGSAVIVMQHLDPDRKSQLTSILEKCTTLPVHEVADAEYLRGDTIYVMPAGKYGEIHEGGILKLIEPPEARFHRNPIDHLLRQMAEKFGANAVGVILSGTGSDAKQGVRDIRSAGGAVLVQDPDDAEFDGMPRAAISTGVADHIAPAPELARAVGRLCEVPSPVEQKAQGDFAEQDMASFEQILRILHEENGFDFSEYKPGTIGRRINRRMSISELDSIEDYIERLQQSGRERDLLIKDLMIGVTRFFRDQPAWDAIATTAIDPVLDDLSDGDTLRAWVSGCSTGEEAYTLAITIIERIRRSGKQIRPLVFASDLNAQAIERARSGHYPASAVDDMSADRVDSWFERLGHDVRVRPRLREKLIFAVQNAVSDPPFSGLDLVSCRNLLIYLEPPAQARLFETFHFALKPRGYLVLGLSEGAERAEPWFEPVDKKHRILRRTDIERRVPVHPAGRWNRMRNEAAAAGRNEVSGSDYAVRAMLKRFGPPAVLVDQNFDIKRFHGELNGILDFSPGSMSGNLVTLLSQPFQSRVWSALNAARNNEEFGEVLIVDPANDRLPTRVVVEPLDGNAVREFLVYFIPTDASPQISDAGAALAPQAADYRNEMDALRRELQSVTEQGETSSEELQAANEEILSANEELQSSNEELETSREELQSLNEELSTINSELEEKVRELEDTNDDLTNLISSTDIATLFLDTDLMIRRFSAKTVELVSIRDSDVGRPISELRLKVDDDALLEDARSVLRTLEPAEREIVGEDHAYLRHIVPYRTRKDQIEGVVVTYSDVTTMREASQKLAVQALRQASTAELSEMALRPGSIDDLFARAASDIADHLRAKVVEIQMLTPDKSHFKLVAGSGWPRGVAGYALSPNAANEHLGFTLKSQQVVEVRDIFDDERFSPSPILADRTVAGGICLSIGTPQAPSGVLGAWRDQQDSFDAEEKNFMSTVAKILWLAVNHSESQRQREHETHALQDLIDGLPVMVALVDNRYRISMSNRTFEMMGLVVDEVRDASVQTVFGDAAVETLKQATPDGDGAVRFETNLPIPGYGERTFLLHCAPRRMGNRLEGYYIAAIDIDERKRWEERNKVISAELDHRVKNILSLVISIARMTGGSSSNIGDFQTVFSARIQSLARTHSALAQTNWDGVHLDRLLRDELEAFASGELGDDVIAGPRIQIGPSAAQSLALAFHEMATNAAKYGALSVPSGRLHVSWKVGANRLLFTWRESGMTSVTEPEAEGFGSTVIRSAVETQLEGETKVRFEPTGVIHEFIIPMETLKTPSGPK